MARRRSGSVPHPRPNANLWNTNTPFGCTPRMSALAARSSCTTPRLGVNRGTESRIDHLVWMIQNHPEWDGFTANPLYCLSNPRSEQERGSYDLLKKAWLKRAVLTRASGIVLHNASTFFALREPALAVELLERAIKVDPRELVYVERLGMLYAICLMPSSLEPSVTDNPMFGDLASSGRE